MSEPCDTIRSRFLNRPITNEAKSERRARRARGYQRQRQTFNGRDMNTMPDASSIAYWTGTICLRQRADASVFLLG